MGATTHIVDPDADTIITLRNPSTVFALWECSVSDISPNANNDKTDGDPTSDSTSVDLVEDTDLAEVEFHVSSRHLMLASPWFKRALSSGWAESARSEEDGLFHVTATEWDEDAFLIIMNILHLRIRQVPKEVTLEMLSKIAVIVDYYKIGESIELFTEMWISSLRSSENGPSYVSYSRDLVLWLLVSWVFDISDWFDQATYQVIKQSDEALRTMELPLPPKLSVRIDQERCRLIESMITRLHDTLDEYRSDGYKCSTNSDQSFQCGSYLLGTLTKELSRLKLLSPYPTAPFLGVSYGGLCEKVKTITSPPWATGIEKAIEDPKSSSPYNHYRPRPSVPKRREVEYHGHACGLGTKITAILSSSNSSVVGLNLSDFKKSDPSEATS